MANHHSLPRPCRSTTRGDNMTSCAYEGKRGQTTSMTFLNIGGIMSRSTSRFRSIGRRSWPTLHYLTRCTIGQVTGMVLGAAFGWSNGPTIGLAVALAFLFGYAMTLYPLRRAEMAWGTALVLVQGQHCR